MIGEFAVKSIGVFENRKILLTHLREERSFFENPISLIYHITILVTQRYTIASILTTFVISRHKQKLIK